MTSLCTFSVLLSGREEGGLYNINLLEPQVENELSLPALLGVGQLSSPTWPLPKPSPWRFIHRKPPGELWEWPSRTISGQGRWASCRTIQVGRAGSTSR